MYRVREIFYTLQGEGANAGRPAVFARFSGCNLWDGREESRATATCRFCDTDFVGGRRFADASALVREVRSIWPSEAGQDVRPLVVLTGGEPTLQVDRDLTWRLRAALFEVAIETNGTRPIPDGVDHVCVSPKAGTDLVVTRGEELKLVYPQPGAEPSAFEHLDFRRFYLQAMDGPDREANERAVAAYRLAHPRWSMSFQLHKYLGLR